VHRLYVVNSSHPSETVKKALELKGIPYKTVELPVPMHRALMRLRFDQRTVPAMRLVGGEKISGSRAILRRLDELVTDPPLLPSDAQARAAVLEAETWGDDVLQPLVRRAVIGALKRCPGAIPSYQEASKLAQLPGPMVRALAPRVVRIQARAHGAGDEQVKEDLQSLRGHLDHIDGLIGEGVLGGQAPNAADLQIGSSIRLLSTIGDIRPLLAGRPSEALALALFADFPGEVPAGVFPRTWLKPVARNQSTSKGPPASR